MFKNSFYCEILSSLTNLVKENIHVSHSFNWKEFNLLPFSSIISYSGKDIQAYVSTLPLILVFDNQWTIQFRKCY